VELCAEVEIEGSPAPLWEHITRGDLLHEWSPFLTSLTTPLPASGAVQLGASPPNSRELHLTPRVDRLHPGEELHLVGTLVHARVLTYAFSVQLTPLSEDSTRVLYRATATGWLLPFLGPLLTAVARGLAFQCQALKRRAEGTARA